MATVCSPATGTVSAAFAQAAKHYAVEVDLCPPRHGNRKGAVEKANHSAAGPWWRTVADDATVTAACGDVVPGCEARWVCSSDEEVLFAVAQHARAVHGLVEVPPELVATVRAAITPVAA